jgi:hypothetical protein
MSVHSSAASQSEASPRSERSKSDVSVDWGGDQPELAADVSEDDDDTAGPGKPREKFSRSGIPCATAGVEHIGECFIRVSARWMDNVTDIDEILAMRKDWLERHQAGPGHPRGCRAGVDAHPPQSLEVTTKAKT